MQDTLITTGTRKGGRPIFAMYTNDNNNNFFSGEGLDNGRWWLDPLQSYFENNKGLLLCPTTAKPYTKGIQNPFGA